MSSPPQFQIGDAVVWQKYPTIATPVINFGIGLSASDMGRMDNDELKAVPHYLIDSPEGYVWVIEHALRPV